MSEADALEEGTADDAELADNERRRSVQSIKVGSRLLEALAEAGCPLHLRELSERAGMHPSKARRYLISFLECGLVEQNAITGRYDLGPMALRLGFAALSRMDPIRLTVEAANALSQEIDRTVLVAVWSDHGPIIISWFDSSEILACNLRVGSVLPLTASASGKIFLTHLPRRTTQPLVDRAVRQAQQLGKPPGETRADVQRSIEEVRRQGFATTSESLLPGLSAISAPVIDSSGNVAAAITEIHKADAKAEIDGRPTTQIIVDTAKAVSERLGYDWKIGGPYS